ncbi:unnamed protein product, partial [Iphiclides podalirius]
MATEFRLLMARKIVLFGGETSFVAPILGSDIVHHVWNSTISLNLDKFPLDKESEVHERKAILRLIQGIAYLVAFQVGVTVFNVKYMQSDEFLEDSLFYRHVYCGLWAHFALYKYISCWLLTEASCIRFGISYNGEENTEMGVISKWDGCNNIKLLRFEEKNQ